MRVTEAATPDAATATTLTFDDGPDPLGPPQRDIGARR